MIKKKLIILYLFCSFISYAQEEICGEVMYKEEANISLFFQTISITKFNSKQAFTKFIHYKKAKPFLDGTYDAEHSTRTQELVFSSNDNTNFVYNSKNETYFTDNFWRPTLVVKDDDFDWNWELINKTKKIGKFNCQKASIKFRGRTFIAWFTKEIPLPFGPRKFKGLPGLILEIYDDEEMWYMKALEVKLYDKCKIDLTEFEKAKPKSISIQKYLKTVDSLHINDAKKELSRLGKEARINIPSECERFYNGQMVEIFEKK